MGYRVTQSGEIICDTADEAIELSKRMRNSGDSPPYERESADKGHDPNSRWTESRFREFINSLNGHHQKTLLNELMDNPHGKTDAALRSALGVENNMALAGVIAGLIRTARKLGIGSDDLLLKEKLRVSGEKVLEYKLANSFRSIAERSGGLRKRT